MTKLSTAPYVYEAWTDSQAILVLRSVPRGRRTAHMHAFGGKYKVRLPRK